jgi:TonB family protein
MTIGLRHEPPLAGDRARAIARRYAGSNVGTVVAQGPVTMTKPRRLLLASLPALLFAACATTGTTSAPAPAAEAATISDETFLKLKTPARVDDSTLGTRIADRYGEVSAALHLCVAPDGSVSTVELARSSGMPAFDAAVLEGAQSWSYEPFVAADDAPRCKDVAVSYTAN